MSAVLLAEAIGHNVISAVVPFALLHTAIFNTALTVAVEMKVEMVKHKIKKLSSDWLTNLLSKAFNTLRHAQLLTITGAVIHILGIYAFQGRESKSLYLDCTWWGMIIAISSEMKTPKIAVLTIITGIAVMAFGSIDGQKIYEAILINISILSLFFPFIIIYLGYIMVKNVPLTGLAAVVITFVRPRAVRCFFSCIVSQYLALMKAILRTVIIFWTIAILGSITVPSVITFLFMFPYKLWGDDASLGLLLPLSVAAAVTIICWQGAVGPAAFILPATFIYFMIFSRSEFTLHLMPFSALLSFLVAESNVWSVEVTLQANNVM